MEKITVEKMIKDIADDKVSEIQIRRKDSWETIWKE